MKTSEIKLINGVNRAALSEIKDSVSSQFSISSIILFGSAARGETDSESDVDLLVLTEKLLSHRDRHAIADIIDDINIKYDANFSATTCDIKSWHSGMVSVLPFHDEVVRDGIVL